MADTMNLLEWKLRLAELFDAYVTKDAEREDGDAEVEEVEEIYEALRDHIRTDPVVSGSAQPSPPADAALADRITPPLIIHYGQLQHENDKLREEIAALRARAVPDEMTAVAVLSDAMKHDSDYAWSWHCNVAMTAQDAGAPHDRANVWAANFMRNAFNVDTLTQVNALLAASKK